MQAHSYRWMRFSPKTPWHWAHPLSNGEGYMTRCGRARKLTPLEERDELPAMMQPICGQCRIWHLTPMPEIPGTEIPK